MTEVPQCAPEVGVTLLIMCCVVLIVVLAIALLRRP